MALDAIWEKKGRSFLTMLGIIIGVASVLILVAMVSGYNADITAYYEKLGVNKVTIDVTMYDRTTSIDITDICTTSSTPTSRSGSRRDAANDDNGHNQVQIQLVDTSTVYMGGDRSPRATTTRSTRAGTSRSWTSKSARMSASSAPMWRDAFRLRRSLVRRSTTTACRLPSSASYYQKDGSAEESLDDMLVMPYSLNRSILQTSSITT
jgi:putative ABC transport system permease protein